MLPDAALARGHDFDTAESQLDNQSYSRSGKAACERRRDVVSAVNRSI